MSPNILVNDVETPTVTLESTSPLTKGISAVALSVAMFVGQGAQAVELTKEVEVARVSCIAETNGRLWRLQAIIDKARAAWEGDKVERLTIKYNKDKVEWMDACNVIAAADAKVAAADAKVAAADAKVAENNRWIAEANARTAQLNILRISWEKLSAELKTRLNVVANFNKGDPIETNRNIALLGQLNDHIRLAKSLLTDPAALAAISNMEMDSRELAMRIGKPEVSSGISWKKTL